MELRELTYFAVGLRLLSALVMGGILGLERGMKNRPAGLRTYMLVCVGSCLIMMTNQYIFQATGTGDPTRMSAQVISGIGFLGAGTIIVTGKQQVKGLTTAAGLWASACVGLAIGAGFYECVILAFVLVFLVVRILLDDRPGSLATISRIIAESDANVTGVDHTRVGGSISMGDVAITINMETKGHEHCELVLKNLRADGFQPVVIHG